MINRYCTIVLRPTRAALAILGMSLGAFASVSASDAPAAGAQAEMDAYWKVVSGRAQTIVEKIEIDGSAKSGRVRDIIARQYQSLNALHEERDAAIGAVEDAASAGGKSKIEAIRLQGELAVRNLHYHFLAQLAAELTPVQIDQVKDGMTYGVLPITYHRYTLMFPDLEEEHLRYMYSALVEAREFAMDEGSSEDKHRRFGKYKGRINNYLSKLGIDMKEAERVLAEKERKK